MSTVNIELADIMVVLDKGEQYNVNIKPGESYHVNVNPADSYHVVVRQPNTVVVTDRDMFFRVTDYATMALSASYAVTASYALNAGSPSFPYSGSAVITGSLQVTDYVSASFFSGDGSGLTNIASTLSVSASNATSGSVSLKTQGLIVSGAYNITTEVAGQTLFIGMATASNLSVNIGTSVISLVPTASYTSAFFDYTVNDGTNYRAGTVTSVWLGTVAQFTDVSTTDIGNTAGVVMAVDVVGANARLKATVASNNWVIKTLVRAL